MRTRVLLLVSCLALALPSAGARADGGDTTGISADTITIGMHVPLTGAAPVQPAGISEGKDLLWKYYENDLGQLVNGRHVTVEFRDDSYNPTQAVAVCNQMAQDSFLLLGAYGTDDISACAQYSDQRGIPYLSNGVQQIGLENLSTYFALSPTWDQQGKLVADFVVNDLGAGADRYGPGGVGSPPPSPSPLPSEMPLPLPTVLPSDLPVPIPSLPLPQRHVSGGGDGHVLVGLVRPNTGAYDGAEAALRAVFDADGYTMNTYEVQKEGTSADAQSVATNMRADGVDVAIVMTAPNFTVLLGSQLDSYSYAPVMVGESITGGFDDVLQNSQSCRSGGGVFDGSSFFSPWPASSDPDAFDPDFMKAVREYAPDLESSGDLDWALALWGMMKDVRRMLVDAGPGLTRQSFVQTMDDGESVSSGVYPDASFSSSQHLGATALHRLQASCADQRFHEADAFVTDYPPHS